MQPTKDLLAFRFFTEIGIIEQLARNQLEASLPDGIKMAQFVVLNHLVRLGDETGEWAPARLANALQVTKGAMTNTLQRLEKRQLVSITPDPHDGRGKLVEITSAGREMRLRCVSSITPFLTTLSKEVSERELASVLPVLEKVREYLDLQRS